MILRPGPFDSIKSTLSFKQTNNVNSEIEDWRSVCNDFFSIQIILKNLIVNCVYYMY